MYDGCWEYPLVPYMVLTSHKYVRVAAPGAGRIETNDQVQCSGAEGGVDLDLAVRPTSGGDQDAVLPPPKDSGSHCSSPTWRTDYSCVRHRCLSSWENDGPAVRCLWEERSRRLCQIMKTPAFPATYTGLMRSFVVHFWWVGGQVGAQNPYRRLLENVGNVGRSLDPTSRRQGHRYHAKYS